MGDSHYEVLGISPRANPEQVEKAYRHCLSLYEDGSVATYSLLDAADLRAARSRVKEAYEVLRDPRRRQAYDLATGLVVPTPLIPFPNPPGAGAVAPVPVPGAAAPVPVPDSPPPLSDPVAGSDLRRFREWRGVSLKEIAASSKIGVRFLEYIEADRFEMLPALVYMRGFLHEYARALGLDARRIADSYLSRLPRR